jgi:hypothetical protein
MGLTPVEGNIARGTHVTLEASLKEPDSSDLWTEWLKGADIRIEIRVNKIRLILMIGAFWNVRRLNKTGRLSCLNEFIKQNRLDFVGIIETKKATFEASFLNAASNRMAWNYLPAIGSAGGILVGVTTLRYEVIEWHAFQFCAVVIIRNCDDQFIWRLVVIYGSPYEEKSLISLLN